jgi:Mn2+/Fe2+ NRAMP family transporter
MARPSQQLTHEDLDRARDRLRLSRARQAELPRALRWTWVFWLLIGPGVLVFIGENDAPSMLSYLATGANFGVGFFLPFVILTFLIAWIVQEMTVRLGAVTHRGHAELIFERFGPFWGAFSMIDLLIGNLLTLITEFIGIRAGLAFFGVPAALGVGLGAAVVILASLTGRYWTWERIALGLAILNGLFVPAALLAHPDGAAVGRALLSWSPTPAGGLLSGPTLLLLLADIGATVTPWMLFFQQGAVVDKGLQPKDISLGRGETLLGMVLAAAFGIAAILASTPLHRHGVTVSGTDFARALLPYLGRVGSSLIALGLLEAGLVAAITISTSSAYAAGEVLKTGHSLNRSPREAAGFYLALGGSVLLSAAAVLIPGVPLEFVVLIVNVVAVLAMPPALILLVLLSTDREVMGDQVSGPWWTGAAVGVTIFLVLAGLLYALSVLDPGALHA